MTRRAWVITGSLLVGLPLLIILLCFCRYRLGLYRLRHVLADEKRMGLATEVEDIIASLPVLVDPYLEERAWTFFGSDGYMWPGYDDAILQQIEKPLIVGPAWHPDSSDRSLLLAMGAGASQITTLLDDPHLLLTGGGWLSADRQQGRPLEDLRLSSLLILRIASAYYAYQAECGGSTALHSLDRLVDAMRRPACLMDFENGLTISKVRDEAYLSLLTAGHLTQQQAGAWLAEPEHAWRDSLLAIQAERIFYRLRCLNVFPQANPDRSLAPDPANLPKLSLGDRLWVGSCASSLRMLENCERGTWMFPAPRMHLPSSHPLMWEIEDAAMNAQKALGAEPHVQAFDAFSLYVMQCEAAKSDLHHHITRMVGAMVRDLLKGIPLPKTAQDLLVRVGNAHALEAPDTGQRLLYERTSSVSFRLSRDPAQSSPIDHYYWLQHSVNKQAAIQFNSDGAWVDLHTTSIAHIRP